MLVPSGPARLPWRLMAAAALVGSALVLVSSFFDDPPSVEPPDGLLRPGSCVDFETNGDAREIGAPATVTSSWSWWCRSTRPARRARSGIAIGSDSVGHASTRHDGRRAPARTNGEALDARRSGNGGDRRGSGLVALALADDRRVILDVGFHECFDLDVDTDAAVGEVAEISTVVVVGCDGPHNAEVIAIGNLNPDGDADYPPDDELLATTEERCAVVFAQVMRGDVAAGNVPVAPNEAAWGPTRGRYVCVALVAGGGEMVGRFGEGTAVVLLTADVRASCGSVVPGRRRAGTERFPRALVTSRARKGD